MGGEACSYLYSERGKAATRGRRNTSQLSECLLFSFSFGDELRMNRGYWLFTTGAPTRLNTCLSLTILILFYLCVWLWPGTGMCVSSHMTVRCRSPLSFSCGSNINQRLLTWLYTSDTQLPPIPASLLSIKPRLHAPTPALPETLCFLLHVNVRLSRRHSGVLRVRRLQCLWAGIGGRSRSWAGFSSRHQAHVVVAAGCCLLIHTEGSSWAHCTCSGLCVRLSPALLLGCPSPVLVPLLHCFSLKDCG